MKDHLRQLILAEPVERREHLAREYLQLYLLRILQTTGAVPHLAFLGGTALRILHRLPRFSEDLDFCVTGPAFDPRAGFRAVHDDLVRAGYSVTSKAKAKRTVASVFFRFDGMPHELGWDRDPRIGLSIKLDVDTRPPAGARIETTMVHRFFPIAIRHHDLPSLFAGKLHALVARPYAKGRDWFDLTWYLTEQRGLEPNGDLFAAALRQTGHAEHAGQDWRRLVATRMESVDWKSVVRDVEPFLESDADLERLDRRRILDLLGPHPDRRR